ncbi:MAG TPA: ATP-binding protein [Tahibacter sp.]|nr:ATP-binding protein [Tahibacter sp.]
MKTNQAGFLRKYRAIVVAIALFVTIDIALIAYNVTASYRIDRLAAARDLSGSERSSSQIVLRALLELHADYAAKGIVNAEAQQALRERATLIENANRVFRDGGRMPNDAFEYAAASTPASRQHVEKITALWSPYYALLQPVMTGSAIDADALNKAVDYARANNAPLFAAINDLVNDAQDRVNSETSLLRIVQVVGILLALLNFLFTALLAFRRLASGDRAIAKSQKQTGDILATVKEGLFLITPDYKVGEQMSASLKDVLRKTVPAGQNLFDVLEPMVTPQMLDAARDYVELLFGKRVKESLVYSLNPLSEVEVGVDAQKRYLGFQFNRVLEGDDVSYLLVTVHDATERVNLAAQVAAAKSRTREEMEVLLRVLSNDPTDVREFLRRTESALEQINDGLRQVSRRTGENYLALVNAVFRSVHSIKSEAAALNLEMFEGIAHDFETDLIALRDRGDVEGSDMVKLTLHLDDLFESVSSVRGFLDRISGSAVADAERAPSARFVESLRGLGRRIAADMGKEVKVSAELPVFDRLPETMADEIRGIGLQLLRNAVAHGIEDPDERKSLGKSAIGLVHFACRDVGHGTIEFTVRDDGRGISPKRIREALTRGGRYAQADVDAMSDRDVVMKIFEPGVSTIAGSTRDAGHGAGMDVVINRVNALSGRISMSTQGHSHTEFRMRFPLPGSVSSEPAALRQTA